MFLLKYILLITLVGCSSLGVRDISRQTMEDKYAHQKDGSRFLNINGRKVHYRDQGKGKVIIALHGIADSLHTWTEVVKELKDEYRFITIDLPGFGFSSPLKKYSPESYNQFLNEIVTELKLKEFYLVGNSLGGYLSWNYAANYPKRVKGLFLLDPAAFPMEELPWIVEMAGNSITRSLMKLMVPTFAVKHTMEQVYSDDSKIQDEVVKRYQELMLIEGNRDSYVDIFREILALRNQYPNDIKKIEAPVFLFWGGDDQWIKKEQISQWKNLLPTVKYKVYEGVGHAPQLETPHLVIKDLKNFLNNN